MNKSEETLKAQLAEVIEDCNIGSWVHSIYFDVETEEFIECHKDEPLAHTMLVAFDCFGLDTVFFDIEEGGYVINDYMISLFIKREWDYILHDISLPIEKYSVGVK